MATLRSFDLRDANETFTDMMGFQATRSRLNGASQNKVYGASQNSPLSDEEGSEFEDSYIETPQSLRVGRTQHTSNVHSDTERGSPNVYITRNTTTKVPLKDASSPQTKKPSTPGHRTSKRVSTPATLSGRISKHRSRNGTPLKQAPVNSERLGDDEDDAIRRSRVLSDDNRFSPYNGQTNHTLGSPVRRKRSEEVVHGSPPSNLKIRPLPELTTRLLAATSTPAQGNVASIDDEEFDSSENEEVVAKSFTKTYSEPLPASRSFEGEYLIKPPPEVRPALALLPEQDRSTSSIRRREENAPKGSQRLSPTPVIPITSRAISLTPQPAETREVSGLRAAISADPLERSSPAKSLVVLVLERMGSDVLSKSEIMEKINSSFNLIREKDLNRNDANVLSDFLDRDDEESDDSQILEEIGSFLPHSDLKITERVLDTSSKSLDLSQRDEVRRLPSISRPLVNNAVEREDPTDQPRRSLAQKYERELLERKERESASRRVNISPSPVPYEEWPMSKWAVLRKLLGSQGLNKESIVNSDVVVNRLQCSGKQELRQRVNYLLEYEKAVSRKKAARRRSKAGR